MNFDNRLYESLIKWAEQEVRKTKVDNLCAGDLINDAYIKIVETKGDINFDSIRREAYKILRKETSIFFTNDSNYLDFGHNNPNYKVQSKYLSNYVCKSCGEIKPISEFYIKSTKDWSSSVESKCISCVSNHNKKKYREKHGKVKEPQLYNIYNENGKIIFTQLTMADICYRLKVSAATVKKILKTGKRTRNIYKKERNEK